MCGILGAYCEDKTVLFNLLVLGTDFLKRRGPDSFGVSIIEPVRGDIRSLKQIIDAETELERIEARTDMHRRIKSNIYDMDARMAISQTRYSTFFRVFDDIPESDRKALKYENSQPMHIDFLRHPAGINQRATSVHNGNIPEDEVKILKSSVNPRSKSIAEVDTRFLTEYYMQLLRQYGDHPSAAEQMIKTVNGSFSFIFSDGNNLVAFKDRWGVRPLCYGDGLAKVITSESGLFTESHHMIEFKYEIKPGELLLIDKEGKVTKKQVDVKVQDGSCLFEPIYFMSHKSRCKSGKQSVDDLRHRMGELTADYYKQTLDDLDVIDFVPNSGASYLRGFAHESKIKTLDIITKTDNKRNYLEARNAEDRNKNTANHLYAVQGLDLEGKNIGLIDDSLMRGDSIVNLYLELKMKGASKVKFYSVWPPNILRCDKGNDTKTNEELVAFQLIEKNIYKNGGEGYTYDSIDEVNSTISDIIREKVRSEIKKQMKMESPKYDLLSKFSDISNKQAQDKFIEDIEIYYAPIDKVLRHPDVFPEGGCTKCLTGIELPGWKRE